MTNIAGRILIIPKGDYDANASYSMLDLVSYNGTSWLARKDATGIEPNEANNEYWHEMVNLEELNEKIDNKAVYYKVTTTVVALEVDKDKYIGQFTAPETGYYFVNGQSQISESLSGYYMLSLHALDKNGAFKSSVHVTRNISGNAGGGGNVAGVFYLEKGEGVALNCRSSLNQTVNVTNQYTYMDIIKL
jgi:hypothetical protein